MMSITERIDANRRALAELDNKPVWLEAAGSLWGTGVTMYFSGMMLAFVAGESRTGTIVMCVSIVFTLAAGGLWIGGFVRTRRIAKKLRAFRGGV